MLSQFVVDAYENLVEITLWVFLVVGAAAGGVIGHMLDQSGPPAVFGVILGGTTVFFVMAVFLGAALVLGEIKKSVVKIDARLLRLETANSNASKLVSSEGTNKELNQIQNCNNCGAALSGNKRFCGACGQGV